MPKIIAAGDLPGLLTPGQRVFVQGTVGEPLALVEAIRSQPEASRGIRYLACPLPGFNRIDYAGFHPEAELTSFFVYKEIEDSFRAGRVRFVPQSYSGIHAYLGRQAIDLALIQVSPPGPDGRCSLGISVDFLPTVLRNAGCVVAEVNRAMPATANGPSVAWQRLDYAVETDRPLPEFPTGALTADVEAVGDNVATLVRDGDTIQIGIGKLPAAILKRLRNKRQLGLHGGMVTDEVLDLWECGALTGERKTIDRGLAVCGAAIGTARVQHWARTFDRLRFMPVGYTHEVRVIAKLDNFVSINSVLAVDLLGQANAEMIGGRQISGTGGLMDFVRGARMSAGGRSILALLSTAAGGRVSRIVPRIGEDGVVSCPRSDIDHVVTEHGIADLRDLSLDERAEALIRVADPAFRDGLRQAWRAGRGAVPA